MGLQQNPEGQSWHVPADRGGVALEPDTDYRRCEECDRWIGPDADGDMCDECEAYWAAHDAAESAHQERDL